MYKPVKKKKKVVFTVLTWISWTLSAGTSKQTPCKKHNTGETISVFVTCMRVGLCTCCASRVRATKGVITPTERFHT